MRTFKLTDCGAWDPVPVEPGTPFRLLTVGTSLLVPWGVRVTALGEDICAAEGHEGAAQLGWGYTSCAVQHRDRKLPLLFGEFWLSDIRDARYLTELSR